MLINICLFIGCEDGVLSSCISILCREGGVGKNMGKESKKKKILTFCLVRVGGGEIGKW